ncbi:conserved protein of unknown function [Rhodovastum atsumiense]|uniref:Antitoxin-like ribbon-helix-helix domain-containing protein n=1 Tax=Rhodovastum atsumiense TaxID=504468 RepID=A0A5M6IK68_9PROT|nr:ribbon-helix-helix domain-containing protein [Rhodovastum atsumiense]KAA5608249.1 hypothetical protein F1189_29945 [Rhodovastum atsumiense]CAH2603443.1 conserved protein of unknown function [Rhodovastum atsumiense]
MTKSLEPAHTPAEADAGSRRQPSRIGAVWVGAHFDPAVKRALRMLAAAQDTTVQALLARAINDLLEHHGHGRPADEAVRPRGGAARAIKKGAP